MYLFCLLQRGPDWYCILVGFINGSVGFYTNTGHLLLLEKFDESTVLKITCHTGTFGTLPDDICILYESSECIVSGSSLFKTLRYAKAQLAKGKCVYVCLNCLLIVVNDLSALEMLWMYCYHDSNTEIKRFWEIPSLGGKNNFLKAISPKPKTLKNLDWTLVSFENK